MLYLHGGCSGCIMVVVSLKLLLVVVVVSIIFVRGCCNDCCWWLLLLLVAIVGGCFHSGYHRFPWLFVCSWFYKNRIPCLWWTMTLTPPLSSLKILKSCIGCLCLEQLQKKMFWLAFELSFCVGLDHLLTRSQFCWPLRLIETKAHHEEALSVQYRVW